MSDIIPPTPRLLTPRARLSFPNLFVAKPAMEGQPPKYSCVLLFDAAAQATPEFAALKAAARKAAQDKWGDKIPANLRSPFRNGSEKPNLDGYEGCVFISMSSNAQNRPGLVQQSALGLQKIIEESDLYAGCYVIVSTNAYVYDTAGNRGVAFGLNNVLKVGEGTPLSKRSNPEQDFAGVAAPPAGATGGAASPSDLF